MMVLGCATFSSIHVSGKHIHDTCLSQLLSYLSFFFLFLPHCSFALLLALAFLCSLSVLSFLYCALTFSFSFLSFSHSCPFKTLHKAYREMSSSRWLSICSGNFLRLVTFAFLSSFSNVASRPRYHNNLCLPAHPCA